VSVEVTLGVGFIMVVILGYLLEVKAFVPASLLVSETNTFYLIL